MAKPRMWLRRTYAWSICSSESVSSKSNVSHFPPNQTLTFESDAVLAWFESAAVLVWCESVAVLVCLSGAYGECGFAAPKLLVL